MSVFENENGNINGEVPAKDIEKEEIRRRFQQKDNSEKIFIPAKPKTNPFEKTGTQRVCAYCRVSTDNTEQLTSFEIQQAYYRDAAEHHPNWDLKRIYADEGISATSLKTVTDSIK